MKRVEKFTEEREAFEPIIPLTKRQREYLDLLSKSEQVIVTGCSGTGKTYIAATTAADGLRKRVYKKIVLTRPNVPSGRSLGHFPGSIDEKFAEWTVPFTEVIKSRMAQGAFEIYQKKGQIEAVPFEVMRGRTFDDAFIILDEAQNVTIHELKMFLTRVGKNSKVVINGDIAQTDLKEGSGLNILVNIIKKYELSIPVIEFSVDDVVRSGICSEWVKVFHQEKI